MDKLVRNWLQRANYDLVTARAMLKSCRYLYVAFMCQQAIEKILKSILAKEGSEILPIHNLVRLAELSGTYSLMEIEKQNFLADLTPYAIEARYGNYKKKLSEIINRNEAIKIMKKTEEVFKWLKRILMK